MQSGTKRVANWLFELDRILRGEATLPRELFRDSPKNADIRLPVGGVSVILGALGVAYGMCIGVFALVRGWETGSYAQAYWQVVASMTKVPLLFLLTMAVMFPSLYVFNALVGSSFKIGAVFRLLMASLVINLSVLASLGPIVAFFSLSSPDYPFIVLLNVAVFALAGFLGLGFMIQTLNRFQIVPEAATFADSSREQRPAGGTRTDDAVESPMPGIATSASCRPGHSLVNRVFWLWMVAFGLVGAQMGWVLRPFIGSPNKPFEWFRARHSNFYESVWNCLQNVFA